MKFFLYLFSIHLLFISFLEGGVLPEELERKIEQEKDSFKRADLHYQLALAYESEQEEEKGIISFLSALDLYPKKDSKIEASPEEIEYLKEAHHLYLDLAYQKPAEIAGILQEKYLSVVQKHPEYYYLNYYLAVASANLGDFEDFFIRFYSSYQEAPYYFLVDRTQGILHLKLWERAVGTEDREKERLAILKHLHATLKQNPGDSTVYKFLIVMENSEKQKEVLNEYLPLLLKEEVPIPRGDLQFFISEALSAKQFSLAQELINKGNNWYEYSHMLTEAQENLNAIKR